MLRKEKTRRQFTKQTSLGYTTHYIVHLLDEFFFGHIGKLGA